MRHANKRYRLNRFTSWRKATLASIAKSLLISQSIKTTRMKAKAARPLIEKLIILAKSNTLTAKRRAFQILQDHQLVSLLFKEIGPRFEKRTSGFTRIIGFGRRRGDNAQMAIFEFTEIKKKEPKKKAAKKESDKSAKDHIIKEVPDNKDTQIEAPAEKSKKDMAVKEKPPKTDRPKGKFLGGIRNIFKKERDSL